MDSFSLFTIEFSCVRQNMLLASSSGGGELQKQVKQRKEAS